ncbi:MAG: type II toxin-antitoxin system VapC family toxin [Spirochaetota bacterium]
MKPKVYIETSVASYLTAWRNPDLIMAANQEITKEWWDNKEQFDLFLSALVIQEASSGDTEAAKRRLLILEGIPEIDITEEVENFAIVLLEKIPLPPKAKIDVLHIAAATVGGMDYLLTWNCKHIANAILRPKIEAIAREYGYEPPIICTPQELWEV